MIPMGDKTINPKMKYERRHAAAVGEELFSALTPFTTRIAIAGSLRRLKPMVSDVEILYIGKTETRQHPDDMFANMTADLADEKIRKMVGILERRKSALGYETFGALNKLMRHCASGIPVDLFATAEENWWVSLVIRTGSKETNLRLTAGAIALGRTLNAYGCGVTLTRDQEIDGAFYPRGQTIAAHSEEEVFELCGVPFLNPADR